MRRKAAAVRGRHSRPHTRPPSSFRCNTRHHHITYDHTPHLAASRRENSSTEGLQQHPERMTRACAVSIMNACLHELVWMLRASSELAWRLASTAQQQWCTGYEPGGCCCSHPSSARERLLSRRWLGTSCSPARRRFETASRQCAPQWRCRAHCPSPARTGRTAASALGPRRGTGTNRSFFPVHSHLRLDPADRGSAEPSPAPPRAPHNRPRGTPARVRTATR